MMHGVFIKGRIKTTKITR